jgi:spore coat polysaccharide biosynthesis protein SpsF
MSLTMSTLAVIQARMASTRFPGKVLSRLGGRPVIDWVLRRLSRAARLDRIVVATSDSASDDPLAGHCAELDIDCFRGSETDVLGRFHAATRQFAADRIVRINADNPFIDPRYIDELIRFAESSGAEYASYHRGDGKPVMLTAVSFFAEVVSRACLERADREITDGFLREHVTLGIYTQPERFRVRWLDAPDFCDDPRLRLTVDTPADLERLEQIATALGERAIDATAEEVAKLVLDRGDLLAAMDAANSAQPKTTSRHREPVQSLC